MSINKTLQSTVSSKNSPSTQSLGKYDHGNPEVCSLPSALKEISGLTQVTRSGNIFTINDEKAIIYEVNNCKIISENKFDKSGDYEGIEMIDDQIYVLKSNGNLIQYDTKSEKKIKEIRNPLNLSNDTEGLAYDETKKLLLIACKGSPNIKKHKKMKNAKAVYAYDIVQDDFSKEPYLVIREDDTEEFFEKSKDNDWSKKESKKRLERVLDFSPSAIAQNPIDKNYYLLSTVGKSMLVMNDKSEILDMIFLDHDAYRQPEGLCFDSSGNMFISNEGRGSKANILKITF